ncbi:hypothetical protein CEXT_348581 [Caerostris extrusa]|uniref:Uncharacterized protein n=1 Tax=Caerostris extrusa TaxID=172846 RepID=A0AAV4WZ73_CAEEX|nr:hypothetical protein CEXT_348581 [Caerostris extrusa]
MEHRRWHFTMVDKHHVLLKRLKLAREMNGDRIFTINDFSTNSCVLISQQIVRIYKSIQRKNGPKPFSSRKIEMESL